MSICRICSAEGNHPEILAREWMFGMNETFDYFQCASCGCLQIKQIPEDMARYYPPEYGAYNAGCSMPRSQGIKKIFRLWRNRLHLDKNPVYINLLSKIAPFYEELPPYLKELGLISRSRILDVGCGDGALLQKLQEMGFLNLTGLEPFQKEKVKNVERIQILKSSLEQLQGEFDIIMLHHVFEHLPDPHKALRSIYNLLAPRGVCLIRIPTVSSQAWEEYRECWGGLEAPRHFYLYSIQSMEFLAQKHGFQIYRRVWDSNEFQFWTSEQIRRSTPLMKKTGGKNWFSPAFEDLEARMPEFSQRAVELNAAGRGDWIQLFLKKVKHA